VVLVSNDSTKDEVVDVEFFSDNENVLLPPDDLIEETVPGKKSEKSPKPRITRFVAEIETSEFDEEGEARITARVVGDTGAPTNPCLVKIKPGKK